MNDLAIRLLEEHGYKPIRELGRGGMGVVLLCQQLSLARPVAVKLLVETASKDPVLLRRFTREARALKDLSHPNLVRLIDACMDISPPFLVMEFIPEATTLEAVIDAGPCAVDRTTSILAGILRALDHVHSHGLVHRDLKPANVLLASDGRPLLIDLGLARLVSADETRQTRSGQVIGTLSYMAPEQLDGGDAGPAADLYSWGLVAYEAFAGRFVFSARAAGLRVTPSDRYFGRIPDLATTCPALNPSIAGVVTRCLAREPGSRPPGAAVVLREVERSCTRPSDVRQDATRPCAGPILPSGRREPTERHPTGEREPGRGPVGRPQGRSTVTLRSASWILAGAAAIGIGLALMFVAGVRLPWPRLERPDVGTPRRPKSSPATRQVVTRAHLEVRGPDVVLDVELSSPHPVVMRWRERGVLRSRTSADAIRHALLVGGPGMRDADEVEVLPAGQSPIDLVQLAPPLMRRLEDTLSRLGIEKLVRRAAFLLARRSPAAEIHADLVRAVPSGVQETLQWSPSLGRAWLLRSRDHAHLRRRVLARVHSLEVLDAFLERAGVPSLFRVTDLLPLAWREHQYASYARDNPRRVYEATRRSGGDTPESVIVDGRAQARRIDLSVGSGFRMFQWKLDEQAGYRPALVADDLLGSTGPAHGSRRSGFKVEFLLADDVVVGSDDVLVMVYCTDPKQSVLWVTVNDDPPVPFCRPFEPRADPSTDARDRQRVLPAGVFRRGRNEVRFEVRPYPGLAESSLVWTGSLGLAFAGARLR
jgi:hypothetical protein